VSSRPTCPYCGVSVSPDARYCDHCGTPLTEHTTTPPRRRRERPSGRIAAWLFLLVMLLVFSTGTMGGYRYRAGHWPLLPVSAPTVGATPDMTGISVPLTKADSTVAGYLRAVVSINVHGPLGNKAGSGFIIDNQGNVATAAHVVQGAPCVTVLDSNGRPHQGTVVGSNVASDVALIRVPTLVNPPAMLGLGDSASLKPNTDVYVLGNPKGLGNAISLPAVITQLHDQRSQDDAYFGNLIKIGGAVVMPGTSGGPLVDKATGRVVGVVNIGTDGAVAWAMPVEEVAPLITEWTRLQVAAPCNPVPAARTTPVVLATITPLSDVDGIDGADLADGALLAIRDMEETLRAAGFEVTLKTMDDKGSPAVGRAMADAALANPNMIGVVGSLGSQVTYAIADELKESRLVVVSPTAGADELTTRGWQNFNRVVASAQRQQQAAASYAKHRLKTGSVFVITDGSPAGARQAASFERAAQTIELPLAGQYRIAAPLNYPDLREQLLAAKAAAVYLAGGSDTAFRVVQAFREDGITLPVLGGDALLDARFRTLTGPAYQGIYFTRLTAEPAQSFQKHFESVLGKPTRGYAAYGYDAAALILTALVRHGESYPAQLPDRAELAKRVRETQGYPGRTSSVTFDPATGENRTSWVYVYEWKQGVPELRENLQ
jgi:branched-chain amino acid transport system substrate-binding protein